MKNIVIKNATIINEYQKIQADILIKNGRFERIDKNIEVNYKVEEIDAKENYLFPGIIDDQVHFREPGLTHKANIFTESRAAVAGGVTSFMEMPNTNPPAFTQDLLQQKYEIASKSSLANYSFFMGTSNDNYDEVMRTNGADVCGVKIFMGSSTGNLLVDDPKLLEKIFANCPLLVATHCEDENTIISNTKKYKAQYGDEAKANLHPLIRNEEACYLSSSLAVHLAKKHNTRLHILHISTQKELDLFVNDIPLKDKRITSEGCVHHINFSDEDYEQLGNLIKCNPAIKTIEDRNAIRQAILDNRIDIIATDHAPHTFEEKQQKYFAAPSGLPLVQHSFDLMYKGVLEGWITIEKVIDKMCHAPSICYNIKERGFIREGYFADFFLFNPNIIWEINKGNIFYKCNWSPLEGQKLNGRVEKTFVNGNLAYSLDHGFGDFNGMRLNFNKK
ncbi:MAG: dihydroorotase [Saprospiraceae bacterium]|nr:dihydroorotase [Saprospiraceae bacterium]